MRWQRKLFLEYVLEFCCVHQVYDTFDHWSFDNPLMHEFYYPFIFQIYPKIGLYCLPTHNNFFRWLLLIFRWEFWSNVLCRGSYEIKVDTRLIQCYKEYNLQLFFVHGSYDIYYVINPSLHRSSYIVLNIPVFGYGIS